MYTVVSLNGCDVSMQDIYIAHSVPARKASSRPNPIICKFVRRQVKERVMAARKEVSKVTPSQLLKCHCYGLVFTVGVCSSNSLAAR